MSDIIRTPSSSSRQSKKNYFGPRKRSFGQNDDKSLKDTLRGARNKSQLTPSKRFHLPREPVVSGNVRLPPPAVINPFESPDIVESRSEDSDTYRSNVIVVSRKFDEGVCRRKSKLYSKSDPSDFEYPRTMTSQETDKGAKKVVFAETDDVDELDANADTDDTSSTASSIDITMEDLQHEVAVICSYESYLSVKQAFVALLERFIEKNAK